LDAIFDNPVPLHKAGWQTELAGILSVSNQRRRRMGHKLRISTPRFALGEPWSRARCISPNSGFQSPPARALVPTTERLS